MKQDIYELSAIQRYPIGFKYPIKSPLDLRSYYYGQAGGVLNTQYGAKSVTPQLVNFAAIALPSAQGSRLLTITVGAGDGALGDGVIGEDELAGGYLALFTPAPMQGYNRMIVANTAQAIPGGVGGPMTLTLDKPFPVDVVVLNFHAECMANPFHNVQTGPFPTASVVGMPTMPATLALPFLWLQTWGPLWGVTALDVSVGANNRQVVFNEEGQIAMHAPAEVALQHGQHAGFVLPNALAGGQGAPFIFLQITP